MIQFKNVSVKYNKNISALRDIVLKINDGEFVFIVGKTGAGKSTLFKLITRELKPNLGTVIVNKVNVENIKNSKLPYYRRTLGVVFQDFRLLDDRNVYENVAFAQEIIGINNLRIKKNVNAVLNLVDIRQKQRKMPSELSGGEKQKVAIARAIINKPKILLADEPTGNLDEVSTNDIIEILKSINETGTTVIVITHDLHLVSRMNKRVLRIDNGKIISDTIGLDDELKKLLNNNINI